MELILWRHAEAEDGTPDLERELTAKGHKQARKMARWLEARMDGMDFRLLASPAARARQTAAALSGAFEVDPALSPAGGSGALLATAGWPDAVGNVLIVGHQPTLGQALRLALTGVAADFFLKKAAVVWLSQPDGEPTRLRALISPKDV